MRTVHSVVNRSPPELLEEVILLDDNSQRGELFLLLLLIVFYLIYGLISEIMCAAFLWFMNIVNISTYFFSFRRVEGKAGRLYSPFRWFGSNCS